VMLSMFAWVLRFGLLLMVTPAMVYGWLLCLVSSMVWHLISLTFQDPCLLKRLPILESFQRSGIVYDDV
jgi:hypothetical protein